MDNVFHEFFTQAGCESCSACVIKNREESEEYASVKKRFSRLFEQIDEALGEDDDLLFRFEETINHRNSLDEEWVYRQGFCDCIYLLRWMGAFSLN